MRSTLSPLIPWLLFLSCRVYVCSASLGDSSLTQQQRRFYGKSASDKTPTRHSIGESLPLLIAVGIVAVARNLNNVHQQEFNNWISVWHRDDRLVYILGVENGSPVSANLTRKIVRSVRPDLVFLELNRRHFGISPNSNGVSTWDQNAEAFVKNYVTMLFPTPDPDAGLWRWMRGKQLTGPTKFLSCTCRISTKEPDEFDQAIQESQKIGATVVLGDRFVSPTVAVFRILRDIFDSQTFGIQDLVYTFKGSRVDVQRRLTTLKQETPRFRRYLIDERDEYMAAGLDCFPRFKSIVTVIGKGHVEGVEKGIKLSGWQPVAHKNKVLKIFMGQHRFVNMLRRWRHPTKV